MKFVTLTQLPDAVYGFTEKKREQYKEKHKTTVLINPEQVGAILPREGRSYTTLIVGGAYIHVAHSFLVTCELLGVER